MGMVGLEVLESSVFESRVVESTLGLFLIYRGDTVMSPDFVKKAPFIVIDGLDGCGKGTQLKLLSERATPYGHVFTITREPGVAPLSDTLRDLFKSDLGANASALSQFLMMWASRRNYLEEVVWPLLEDNIPVFSDHGDSSTLAYHVFAKNAPELEKEFWRLRNLVFDGIAPTYYIFLDVPPALARARVMADSMRGGISHFDAKPLEFYEKAYKGFRVFADHPSIKFAMVNGTRSREEVHEDIYNIVSKQCGW